MSLSPNPNICASNTFEVSVFVMRKVVLRPDFHHGHIPAVYYLPDQVVLPLDMLPSLVAPGFFRIRHRSTVVTVKHQWLIHVWNNFQISKEFLNQTASLAASQAAMYSASMVESAMLDCLILLQTIAPPPRVNTDPDVDFRLSRSDWKSESVYPIGFRSPPEYTSI